MTTPGGPPQQPTGPQSKHTQQIPVPDFGRPAGAPGGPYGPPPQGNPPQHGGPAQGNPPQHGGPPPGAPPSTGPAFVPQYPGGPPPGAAQQGGPSHQPGTGQWPGPPPARSARPGGAAAPAIWVLGLVSVVAVVLGLSIKEDGNNAWHTVHAWGALAILGAVLTLAPVVWSGSSRYHAWQVAAAGAGALVLYWVLFVLPDVGSNTSLATTVGVAAGAVAAWIAADRGPRPAQPARPPGEHTW